MNAESGNSSTTCSLAGQRIVELHPSLRCNLCCEHCYSSSGPWVRSELDPTRVCGMVSDAARMGYQVVSVSGGEPFLYSDLPRVLRHSKSVGMRTTVTTNGYFLQPRWLEPLRDCVDVLAISLDGPPDLHNKMRGSRHAFDRLCAGLENLRACGLNFGLIHTLTRETWQHMVWLAEFAVGNGAHLLQFHPLEMAGRAEEKLRGNCSDEDVSAKAYLLGFALALKYNGSMTIQMDLLHRDQVLRMPELVYADELGAGWEEIAPAKLLSLIVMEADGTVVPIAYGFSHQHHICNLNSENLGDGWSAFLRERYPTYRRLCRELFEELVAPGRPPLFNWYEQVVARSRLAGNPFCSQSTHLKKYFAEETL